MTRPANLPETAQLNEFGQWEVRWSDDLYDMVELYDDAGRHILTLEMEI